MFHHPINKGLAIACLFLVFSLTLVASAHRRDFRVFTPQALLLNYQIAEQAINRPYTNNGAGVIEIRYGEAADDRNTAGSYSLVLMIERLPS